LQRIHCKQPAEISRRRGST